MASRGELSVPSHAPVGRIGTMATLTKIEGKNGHAAVTIPTETLPPAQHSFAADIARATFFRGQPELHFAQIDLFDPAQIVRLVRVRYPMESFVDRVQTNAAFSEKLRARAREHFGWKPKDADADFKDAKAPAVPAVVIDADFEICVYVGDRAGVTFLSSSSPALSRAVQKGDGKVWFDAPLECTMPVGVIADLLDSWGRVVEEARK